MSDIPDHGYGGDTGFGGAIVRRSPAASLADLIAEVAAEHMPFSAFGEPSLPTCEVCTVDWPCDAARLAAALSVENVAAGMSVVWPTSFRGYETESEPAKDLLRKYAAAILAAITVAE